MRATVALALLAMGLFLSGTNAFVIAGLLPDIATSLGSSQTSVGYSVTWYAIVIALVAPIVTTALAGVPKTVLLAGGLLLMAAGTALTLLAESVTTFTVGRCVAAVGGAALVPTSMSVATTLVPASRRGTALAAVALGFTLATAVGAPAGTLLGSAGGWRTPFVVILLAALILAGAVVLTIRNPRGTTPVPLRQRFGVLGDLRVAAALGATVLLTLGFNVVYVFAAGITAGTTGGHTSVLAALLLALGIGGIVGNLIAGPTIDRIGSNLVLTGSVLLQVLALSALPIVSGSLHLVAAVFTTWGAGALAAPVALQHRLATVDQALAPQALSWFASAQYLGIALAPLAAATTSAATDVRFIPWVAVAVLLAAAATSMLGRRDGAHENRDATELPSEARATR